jgi:AAA+ superfamily predicted ATPase
VSVSTLERDIARVEALVTRALEATKLGVPMRATEAPSLEAVIAAELPRDLGLGTSAVDRVAAALDLDPVAHAILVLAVAPCLHLRVAHGYSVLRHDPDQAALTAGIALEVLGVDGPEAAGAILRRLRPDAPLVELALVEVRAQGITSLKDSIPPSPRLLDLVLGIAELPPDLPLRREPSTRPEPLILPPALLDRLNQLEGQVREAIRVGDLSSVPVPVLHGPAGAGKGLVAAHLASWLGRPLLRSDARRLHLKRTGDGDALVLARRVVRESRLQGALLYLEHADDVDPALDAELAQLLERNLSAFALGSERPLAGRALLPAGRPVFHLGIDRPPPADRLELWRRAAPKHLVPAQDCFEVAAHRYRLTGGQIRRAAVAAMDAAQIRGHSELTLEGLDEAVRATVSHTLSSVARLVRGAESWGDLVASDETLLLLRVMTANYRHRRRVFDEWGFSKRFGKGLGLSALFSGPPGTGKTMAAGVLATELGLPLYQVELSQIVSKWVGETEKNLDVIFAEAEAASAIILFDEADSLFAKRTEVSSANDRYANLEVNHLLQRIEAFEGVVILTTNNGSAIDPAFLRRFSYQVSFPVPSARERALLWKRLMPADAPVAGEIDFDGLAQSFEFSGGHVKNAILRAAFFAAELGRPIDAQLLAITGNLELKQLGSAVRHIDLGKLWQALKTGAPREAER